MLFIFLQKRADITKFFKKLLKNKPSIDIPTIEGDILTITMENTADKARDNYKLVDGKPVKMSDEEFAVKLRVESHIDEIAETSLKENKPLTDDVKNHDFAKDGFEYRTAYFEDFDGAYYKIRFSVGHNGTVATVYNVGKIKEDVPSSAKLIAVVGSRALDGSSSNDIILNEEPIVKNNISEDGDNYRNEPDGKYGHSYPEATGGFDYYDAIFKVGNKYYYGLVNIMVTNRGRVFKDLTKIEDITNDIIAQYGNNPQGDFVGTSSTDIIDEKPPIVKDIISDENDNYSESMPRGKRSFSLGSPAQQMRNNLKRYES